MYFISSDDLCDRLVSDVIGMLGMWSSLLWNAHTGMFKTSHTDVS